MSRKKRGAEHASHERWMVSYADFITLMFALFVVLFSSSQMDKRKAGKIAEAIQEAFQQMGVSQVANSRTPMVTTDPLPAETVPLEMMVGSLAFQKELEAVQKQLTSALAPEIQRHEVALKTNREGLVISLREIGFFDSGSAALRPASEAAVKRIAQVLSAQPNNIRIEGHTDNVPIHNAQFASNWELSTARATEMIRLFITDFSLPATRLSAAGYAEFHPVAGNDTVEGRAQNRRVDIVVLASAPEGSVGAPLIVSPRQ